MKNEHPQFRAVMSALTRRNFGVVIGQITVLTALSTLLVGAVPLFEVSVVRPTVGLLVPFGIFFGVSGVLGVTAGMVAGRILSGTLVATDGLVAVTYGIAGLVAVTLWRDLELPAGRQGDVPSRLLVRYCAVGATTALVAGATWAWLHEMAGLAPFFIAPLYWLTFGVGAVVVGGPIFIITEVILRRRGYGSATPSGPGSRSTTACLVAGSLVWVAIGVTASVLYRAFDPILVAYPHWFTGSGIEFVRSLYNNALFGVGGSRIQTVLGAVFLTVVLTAVVRSHVRELEERT